MRDLNKTSDPTVPLSAPPRELFAQEIATGKTQTAAYLLAYPKSAKWKAGTVNSRASDLARVVEVRARIEHLRTRQADAWVFDMAEARRLVLEDALDVLRSDPSELATVRHVCCRYCHGQDHAYHWKSPAEYWTALERAAEARDEWDEKPPNKRPRKRPELPTEEGGYGFNPTRLPAADCPECFGEGTREVFIPNIRSLSGPARRLFAGAEQTKAGIKIHMRDREAARTLLAKHVGLVSDEVTIKGGLAVAAVVAQVTPEQAAAIAKRLADEI